VGLAATLDIRVGLTETFFLNDSERIIVILQAGSTLTRSDQLTVARGTVSVQDFEEAEQSVQHHPKIGSYHSALWTHGFQQGGLRKCHARFPFMAGFAARGAPGHLHRDLLPHEERPEQEPKSTTTDPIDPSMEASEPIQYSKERGVVDQAGHTDSLRPW